MFIILHLSPFVVIFGAPLHGLGVVCPLSCKNMINVDILTATFNLLCVYKTP